MWHDKKKKKKKKRKKNTGAFTLCWARLYVIGNQMKHTTAHNMQKPSKRKQKQTLLSVCVNFNAFLQMELIIYKILILHNIKSWDVH